MAIPARRPNFTPRSNKRILVMLAIGAVLVIGAVADMGLTYWRQQRHKARFLASIQEVNPEEAEREQLKEEARRLLFAGDFDGLDAAVRELRTSRAAFANGTWKLTVLHQGLAGPTDQWSEDEWLRAIDLARAWARERPTSIAARLVLTDLWIGYGWVARGSGWSRDVNPEQYAIFQQRVDEATQVTKDAQGLEERCPRRTATVLRLALVNGMGKDDELRTFERAIREEPDYQPIYSAHLRYLQPRWHGAPGDWERAASTMVKLPRGKEKYARAVWYLHEINSWDPQLVSWPYLKQGFAEMRARHPDSSEIKSATCMFASYHRDKDEAKAMFGALGNRMDTSVWGNRDQFAQAYLWATFEDGEVAGGDPLARFLAWVMGS
jgi:hypothetical protein